MGISPFINPYMHNPAMFHEQMKEFMNQKKRKNSDYDYFESTQDFKKSNRD